MPAAAPSDTRAGKFARALSSRWAWVPAFLAVRLIYSWLIPGRFGDVTHYLADADLILQGRWREIDPYFFQGYFLFVIPLCWLGLKIYWAALVSSYLCSFAGACAAAGIAQRLAGPRARNWAGWLYSLQPIAAAYAAASTMESFYGAAFLLGVWLLLRARDRGAFAPGLLAGLAFGLAILQRNEALFLVALLLVLLLAAELLPGLRAPTISPPRWRGVAAFALCAIGCALVLGLWTASLRSKFDSPVLFAKAARNLSIDPVEDKEAWARGVVNAKAGIATAGKPLGERLIANSKFIAPSVVKTFASPFLLLLPALAALQLRFRRRRKGARRWDFEILFVLMLASCAGYLAASLEARYFYLGMVLSIPLTAAVCAWATARFRSSHLRWALFAVLPALLVVAFAIRTWRDEPRGKSVLGLDKIYAQHVPEGALIYSEFGHIPDTVQALSIEKKITYKPLPFIGARELATLLPADRDEVFVFVDAYYLDAYDRAGLFLTNPNPLREPGAALSRVSLLDASPRNLGYLVKVTRAKE